jgi:hypothetical protein
MLEGVCGSISKPLSKPFVVYLSKKTSFQFDFAVFSV